MDDKELRRASGYFSPRLMSKLQTVIAAPVTVVEAPAGYGKTTAIRHAEELFRDRVKAYWFTALGEDEGQAWHRLCLTLRQVDEATGDKLLELGLPNRVNSPLAVQMLARLDCREESLIVLDNFQNLQKELRAILVASLLNLSSPRIHVVISTQYLRTPQETDQLRYQLNHIRTNDLLLEADDIRAYYAQMGREISPENAQALFHRTEGWPVAISLCLRGEAGMCDQRENGRVDNLLGEVFYNILPQKEQIQLLPFALFEVMSEGQLSQILGSGFGQESLDLFRRTPMIRFDQAAGVYFPHSILRDFLKLRLDSAPEETRRSVYLSAGEWHASRGDVCDAIGCFYAVKAYERILALPLVNLCFAKTGAVTFEKVAQEMLGSCPQETWVAYPIALLRIAYYLFAATDFAGFERAMALAHQVVTASDDPVLLGEWLVMDALSVYPDIQEMGKRWQEALELIGGRCQVIDEREPFLFGCQSMWYVFYVSPGAGDQIGHELKYALASYNALTGGHAGGADVLYLGELACIRGDYEEAQRLAYEAAQLSEDASQPTVTYGAALLLGRIAISRSDLAGLESAIDYMENRAAGYPFMQGSAMNAFMLDTTRAMMRSMMEQTRQAPVWARTGAKRDESLSIATQMTRHAYVTEVMLAGDYNRAIGIMEATLRMDSRLCNLVTRYYLYAGLALCHLALLHRGKAIEALDQSLAIAAPDELLSIFVHHRRLFSLLFIHPQLQQKYGPFITKIQEVKSSFSGASFAEIAGLSRRDLPDSLTDRERQIAELAAQGLHNREIAQREFISEHTVKNHLKTVFAKLDIDRRAKLTELLKP